MNDFARLSRRAVDYIFDRPARNEDASSIWCLGRSYESRYHNVSWSSASAGTSLSAQSNVSHTDSAVVTAPVSTLKAGEVQQQQHQQSDEDLVKSFDQVQLSKSMEEEDLGWPSDFLDDFESRIWLTYRSHFPPIAKSTDPAAAAALSFTTKFRNFANQGGFTSDTGWGCMIRSGQSLLANTVSILRLGREWRMGQQIKEHQEILSLFADSPEAPFSIHKFVEHGAEACGTYPGQWFGPSATARCIRALTDKYPTAGVRVYARPNDGDVYIDSLIATATQRDADEAFRPTLIVLGVRLGIEKVTPAYHAALRATLELPHSVGIAGGRPSSSHYFVGHQADHFLYLDPHTTRPMLSSQPQLDTGDVSSCHTRRVRKLAVAEMDPSMLLGFLVRSREDFEDWRRSVEALPGKAIVHVHEREPKYAEGTERAGAEDEVETLDEDEGDDDDDDDLAGGDDDIDASEEVVHVNAEDEKEHQL